MNDPSMADEFGPGGMYDGSEDVLTFPSPDGRDTRTPDVFDQHSIKAPPKATPLAFGDILLNGATVIQSVETLSGRRFVLAHAGGHHPWVTWEVCGGPIAPYCVSGDYFAPLQLGVAVVSLLSRARDAS